MEGLILTTPPNQARLNAAIFECTRLRVTGPIHIPGCWDAAAAADYLETRSGGLVCEETENDFIFHGKHVLFHSTGVIISPERIETSDPAFPSPVP